MNPETILSNAILAAHGAGPRHRLWRNAVAKVWAGKFKVREGNGDLVLHPGATLIQTGLFIGSADLIGIYRLDSGIGIFLSLEIKVPGARVPDHQLKWQRTIDGLGGYAIIVRSVEDVGAALAELEKMCVP